MTRFGSIGRTLAGAGLALATLLLGTLVAGTGVAGAATVEIHDMAGVLNPVPVQNVAATLPVSTYIWTTAQESMTRSTFEADVRDKVSIQFPIVVGIDTALRRPSVQIGTAAAIMQSDAVSAEIEANSVFETTLKSTRSYTGAVTALLESLKTSLLASSPPTTTATTTTRPPVVSTTVRPSATHPSHAATASTPPHRSSPGALVIVVGIVVLVLMLVVLASVFGRGKPKPKHKTAVRPLPPPPPFRPGPRPDFLVDRDFPTRTENGNGGPEHTADDAHTLIVESDSADR